MKYPANTDKKNLANERKSKRYNQKSAFYGAVWSDDCTALFNSTKKNVNKFVYLD